MFKVSAYSNDNSITLILDENITLCGLSANTTSLVLYYGTLIMNNGSKITGNSTSTDRGGIGVYTNGRLTINDGEISGNSANNDGDVSIISGIFTMSGGEISGNTANYGGGIQLSSNMTTHMMTNGKILGNSTSMGGGIYIGNGTFTMTGGEISGNTTTSSGSAIVASGIFTMTGGEISATYLQRLAAACMSLGHGNLQSHLQVQRLFMAMTHCLHQKQILLMVVMVMLCMCMVVRQKT